MYAVVEIAGKQYKAEKDRVLKTDLLNTGDDKTITFDKVILVSDTTTRIGNPYVEGVKVSADIIREGLDKKITVFKYKPKKDYRRKRGHRQQHSLIRITGIEG